MLTRGLLKLHGYQACPDTLRACAEEVPTRPGGQTAHDIFRSGTRATSWCTNVPGLTTFAVKFLGCKVSQSDAMIARDALLAAGHREVPESEAELHVINTC